MPSPPLVFLAGVAGARGCVIHHVASVRELSGVLRRMAEQVVKMKGSLWMSELAETIVLMKYLFR